MKRVTIRTYSRYTFEATELFGKLIQLGRKERRWTEQELADRLGISRSTLKKIEKGDLRCEVGLVFEAAAVTGVTLFETDRSQLAKDIDLVSSKLALLPRSVRAKGTVKDDF
jgi:transcriptional regulator with XRE-family HTH domain